MKPSLEIGITGGIGSGKSLVCRIFRCLGVPVYDADTQARELMNSDPGLVNQIQTSFGSQAYTAGKLDRAYLAGTVFNNPQQLAKLNSLVHPAVQKDYMQWASRQDYHYVIKEAALIFEAGSYKSLNAVIVVSAPEALRVKRVMQRDPQRSEQDIKGIIRNQMNEDEKLERASFVIVNDESRLVIPQVLKLHQHFLAMH